MLSAFLLPSACGLAQTNVTTSGGAAAFLARFDSTSNVVPSNVYQDGMYMHVDGFVSAATSSGGSFFSAHQAGSTYTYGGAMFDAVTDNPNGAQNFFFRGTTAGTETFSVRADGTVSARSYKLTGGQLGNSMGDSLALLEFLNTNENTNKFAITQFRYTAGSDWYSATTRMQVTTDVTPQGYIDFNPPGGGYGLAFGSHDGEFMRIVSNGNVGVGTTNPSQKLEVAGSIQISGSGNGLKFPDGSTQLRAWDASNPSASLADSNGVVTVRDQLNTGGVQFTGGAPFSGAYGQTIGQAFGPGGHLAIIGNPVAYTSDTGGIIFLGGSERGDGQRRKVWIAGNSQYGAPVNPGLQVDSLNNVGIGINENQAPTARLEVNGNIKLTAGSGAFITFSDGTIQSTAFSGSTCATGGDYAESVDVSGERSQYEPGDVIVIDPQHPGNFLKSSTPYSPFVAGVYSTNPGFTGRRQAQSKPKDGEIPMAMIGIVPVKVTTENGPIHIGDQLVSASKVGYAMKATDRDRMSGAVIGKALGNVDSGDGSIEVLITLQ